uniref:Protein binding protein n=1 Tax=Rhizophora mucronata TaxID=61149 RepID=A0A2P2JXW2_RHIMU
MTDQNSRVELPYPDVQILTSDGLRISAHSSILVRFYLRSIFFT